MNANKLTLKQKILVAGTLFGMFFGAGNLIFPVHLGQMAGSNVIYAIIGFVITAVGIPILGVAAIGITHSDRRPADALEQGWQGLRNFLHLHTLPYDRSALRYSEMRYRFLYHRRYADARQKFARMVSSAYFFGCVFRLCFVFFAPSGQNNRLDR